LRKAAEAAPLNKSCCRATELIRRCLFKEKMHPYVKWHGRTMSTSLSLGSHRHSDQEFDTMVEAIVGFETFTLRYILRSEKAQ